MTYSSYDALIDEFAKTVLDVQIVDSRVQVKDILTFAPQVRSNKAFSNPNATWYINIDGSGTFDRLTFNSLQFQGLHNTVINAKGTLTGLSNPQQAGGNFIIDRLHTSQTDIALFTGQRLSNDQLNLPEEFDISGTIQGNSGVLNTKLDVNSSAGSLAVNGRFSNLMDPQSFSYQANIRTSGLRLGSILRKPAQFGNLSGSFSLNGKGTTPNTINTSLTGNISSFGYNRYTYRNMRVKGTLKGTAFTANADVNDPNADLNLKISGNLSANPAFRFSGMIDSIKTLPLHFTPEHLVFRGKIDGSVSNIAADNPTADVLLSKALFVAVVGENASRMNW